MSFGESSIGAIKREIKEEVGYEIDVAKSKLFCIHENFYKKDGIQEHWIEKYYVVEIKGILSSVGWSVAEVDKGEKKVLNFRWASRQELARLEFKPSKIKELLLESDLDEITNILSYS